MKNVRIGGLLVVVCFLLTSCQVEGQSGNTAFEKIKSQVNQKASQDFSVKKSEDEWRKELSPAQYHILRNAGTEGRFSSPLLAVNEDGQMVCAACGNPLFDTKHKFKSTCGWPTFDEAIDGAVVYKKDTKYYQTRIEVRCAKCGSHLGHVFNDGPRETTGVRYCIDGLAMQFVSDEDRQDEQ